MTRHFCCGACWSLMALSGHQKPGVRMSAFGGKANMTQQPRNVG